jgi:ABC-type multidrug transport system fused ATPase/permease subunit
MPPDRAKEHGRVRRRGRSGGAVVSRQARDYAARLAWLGRDTARVLGWRIAPVLALNAIGVGCALATAGGIVLFVRALERGEPSIHLAGLEIPVSGDAALVGRYAAALAAFGLLSAAALYAGERLIGHLTVIYQRTATKRLIAAVADPCCAGWQLLVDAPASAAVSHLAGMGVRLTALASRTMLRAVLPMLAFAASAGALIAVDAMLTLLLAPMIAAYLIPLYLINRGVARLHRAHRDAAPPVRRSVTVAVREALESPDPARARDRADAALDDPAWARLASLFWRRKLADARVQWANSAFFVASITLIFVFFAFGAADGERTWSEFLAFIVALQFAMRSVRLITSRFVRLSRYLPEYRAYADFIAGAEGIRASRAESTTSDVPSDFVIRCGEPMWDGSKRLSWTRSGAIWVVTPVERPSRADMIGMAAAMQRALREEVDLLASFVVIDVRADEAADDDDGQPPDAALVIVRSEAMLDDTHMPRVKSSIGSSHMLVIAAGGMMPDGELVPPDAPHATGVAVIHDHAVVSMGDLSWWRDHEPDISAWLTARRAEVDARFARADADDDEEADDDA